jgi:hypothetical protein
MTVHGEGHTVKRFDGELNEPLPHHRDGRVGAVIAQGCYFSAEKKGWRAP